MLFSKLMSYPCKNMACRNQQVFSSAIVCRIIASLYEFILTQCHANSFHVIFRIHINYVMNVFHQVARDNTQNKYLSWVNINIYIEVLNMCPVYTEIIMVLC